MAYAGRCTYEQKIHYFLQGLITVCFHVKFLRIITFSEKNALSTSIFDNLLLKRKELREGGHFDPSANSETKEARTIKLCTVIVYYIV